MQVNLVFGPGCKLSREYFSSDFVAEALLVLFGFGNDRSALDEYLDEHADKVSSSAYLIPAGTTTIDGMAIPQTLYDQITIGFNNVPSEDLFVVVGGPVARAVYDKISISWEDGKNPSDEDLMAILDTLSPEEKSFYDYFQSQVAITYQQLNHDNLSGVEPLILACDLADDQGENGTAYVEPAMIAAFRGGHRKILQLAEMYAAADAAGQQWLGEQNHDNSNTPNPS